MSIAAHCLVLSIIMLGVANGETLYNGIVLPAYWPPKRAELTREPLATPPYLSAPPAVIPIDVGRQLFVDDFLVEKTTLTRTYHLAEYHPSNPVIAPDKPWEGKGARMRAGVFSDGVWYDPTDKLFKCWYWASVSSDKPLRFYTCYATSRDGIHWQKPSLDVVPGTNAVLHDDPTAWRNSNTVWLDLDEKNPQRRFKMFRVVCEQKVKKIKIHFSPDGIHWTLAGTSDDCGDRSTVFYNPFRKVWVCSLRDGGKEVSRCRRYFESRDAIPPARWGAKLFWIGADKLDPDRSDLDLRRVPERSWDLVPSQLYNLDCVAYESLMLGCFSIWRGQPEEGRPKINEVCLGFSRDGFHWTRPDRRAFCPVSENKDAWNFGNVQSAGGCCLVVGDKLYFYVGGTSVHGGSFHPDPSSTGLAMLRRDGFASMDAARQEGTLTTRKLKFSGRHLFVNVDAPKGKLQVEVLDADGNVIAPFMRNNCVPVTADSTIQCVKWKSGDDLSALAGKPVRFRFHLKQGRLYAFWVSPEESGASHGYVAAGGAGFTGTTDTVGVAAYSTVKTEQKPNVLFIAVDDLRPQLGCYGDRLVKSPNIDRLASQGVLFERAYCQQAICMASRASLMSGYRPDKHRIFENGPLYKTVPDAWSMNRHFQKNGYETVTLSKVYHHASDEQIGWSAPAMHPKGAWKGRGYLAPEAQQLGEKEYSGRGPAFEAADVPDSAYPDGVTLETACAQLDRLKKLNRPFFLAVGFLKPHLPFNAPKRYWDLYDPNIIPLAPCSEPPKNAPACALTDWSELRKYAGMPQKGPVSPEQARQLIHGYCACVSYIDALIGRLLDRLEKLGLDERTVVVLWGDNGWKLGDYGMWCKHTNFEMDARIPLIIRARAQGIAPGRTRGLAELVDLYPTLCELTGLSRPDHLEGMSLVPLMRNPGLSLKRAAFSQYPKPGIMGRSVRTERYRYTEWRKNEGNELIARELYDFETDPLGATNVAGDPSYETQVKEIAAILNEQR
jgi:arylsulfatase A-like enzyme